MKASTVFTCLTICYFIRQ